MTDLGLTPHILIRPKKPAFWGGFFWWGSVKICYYSVGTCLWHVSNALIYCRLHRNMPKAKALKKSKRGILEPLETAYCG